MNIDRHVRQGDIDLALNRLDYCLTVFENSKEDLNKVFQKMPIEECSVEEMIGAMISAEQSLIELKGGI